MEEKNGLTEGCHSYSSHRFLVNFWEPKVGGKQIYLYVCCINSPLHVTQSLSPSSVLQVSVGLSNVDCGHSFHLIEGVDKCALFARCFHYWNFELWTIVWKVFILLELWTLNYCLKGVYITWPLHFELLLSKLWQSKQQVSPADFFFHTAIDTLQTLKNTTQNLVLPTI